MGVCARIVQEYVRSWAIKKPIIAEGLNISIGHLGILRIIHDCKKIPAITSRLFNNTVHVIKFLVEAGKLKQVAVMLNLSEVEIENVELSCYMRVLQPVNLNDWLVVYIFIKFYHYR